MKREGEEGRGGRGGEWEGEGMGRDGTGWDGMGGDEKGGDREGEQGREGKRNRPLTPKPKNETPPMSAGGIL